MASYPVELVMTVNLFTFRSFTLTHSTHSHSTGEKASLEKEVQCGMVVSADDPELLDKVDQAAEKGE